MNNFQKPIDSRDPSKEWMTVHRVEGDKKEKEPFSSIHESDQQPKPLVFSAFTAFLKKKFNLLFALKSDSDQSTLENLTKNLLALKKILQILGDEDKSRNPEFSTLLSKSWNSLSNASQDALLEKKNPQKILKLKLLINAIQAYPTGQDHSLGFYLDQQAGIEWLPFPFMDLLKQLHLEFQGNPKEATLTTWITSLDEILSSL
jgi:hypothetical protein